MGVNTSMFRTVSWTSDSGMHSTEVHLVAVWSFLSTPPEARAADNRHVRCTLALRLL